MVLNTPCKLIKGVLNGLAVPVTWMATYTTLPNYRSYITYEQNSVLYLFNGSSFDTLVNYNASVGDKWRAINPCRPRQTYTVTSTGMSNIGNLNLRTIGVNFIDTLVVNGTPQYTTNGYTFIERIMSPAVNYQNLMPIYCAKEKIDTIAIDDSKPHSVYFCSYTDNNFSYSPISNTYCHSTLNIYANNSNGPLRHIRPNPNKGFFQVEMDEDSKLSVYNSLGGLVYENYTAQGGTLDIDLGALAPGIYFLTARSKTATSFQKFVKE